ncbi:MAG: V-type ATPase 116kDa subunit family protein [Bacteroidia bacterium]|nr:V-type ATPase 116kDa subunit family protein [Bacteroidia bacterium]
MITKMKKIDFLVFYKEYDAFLEHLRDLGVIHVVEKQNGTLLSADEQNIEALHQYQDAINDLQKYAADGTGKGPASKDPLTEYQKLVERKSSLGQKAQNLSNEVSILSQWGEFDSTKTALLAEAGYQVRFYVCQPKNYSEQWEQDRNAFVIDRDKNSVHFVTIEAPGSEPIVNATVCTLPEKSLSNVQEQLSETSKEIDILSEEFTSFASSNIDELKARRLKIKEDIDLSHVKLSTDSACDDKLMLLEGWIPAKLLDDAEKALDEEDCFYQVFDPTPEDDIPIQMSNNRFFSLFEPFTKLYMLPSYGELDLTPFFAPFFMLFFGLCLGDIGYGLLMILAMPVFDKLFKLINPDFSKWLVPLFGGSTMICGLLTGTAFGFNLYDLNIPFLQKLKDIFYQDNSSMFTLSLIIGGVQILFGMILKAVNLTIQCGFKYAISTIGWIILLVTVAVAVLTGIGVSSIPVIILLVIAGIMIYLFNSPGKNPFLNIGLGLWDTYNMATGLLGDVLSYVRLFALGLSGGILASVFNSLAVGMSPKVPVLGFIVMALIFLIGHAINIFMNFLGAIVHPMRLTFVEFFKNAGYTGGGKTYKPFAKQNQ